MKKRSAWLEDTLRWARTLPRHDMSHYEQGSEQPTVVYHHVPHRQPPEPPPSVPMPAPTPLAEVQRLVAAKRAELRAAEVERQYRGTPGQRRLANEAAKAFKDALATTPPNPYDEAIKQRRQLDLLREARR